MKSRKPHLRIVTAESSSKSGSQSIERSNVAVLAARRAENTNIIDMWSWQPVPPAAA